VVTWRNESLGAFSHPVTDRAVVSVGHQRPSALAALRAFFDFAPLWMKGAVAFAAILFCLTAGLAIANWRTQQPAVTIANTGGGYSQQEFNAAVERRVQEQLDRQKNSSTRPSGPTVAKNPADRIPTQRSASRVIAPLVVQSQKARRPLSKSEREQLAADLRLVSGRNEGDFDLLGDRINQ
jgi:hypothetical protein